MDMKPQLITHICDGNIVQIAALVYLFTLQYADEGSCLAGSVGYPQLLPEEKQRNHGEYNCFFGGKKVPLFIPEWNLILTKDEHSDEKRARYALSPPKS